MKILLYRFLHDPVRKAVLSLIVHLCFAFYNGILGFLSGSRILLASCAYYLILSSTRFAAVVSGRKRKGQMAVGIGALLVILSLSLGAVVFISIRDNTASAYGQIPMITIATYTFIKIIIAIITAAKQKHTGSPLHKTLRMIRCAEVAVSLLTMQQSMLVSFGEANYSGAYILNIFTGTTVFLFILTLGILTIQQSRKDINHG